MSVKRYESNGAVRRANKVRARVKASGRLRLSIFRSARHVYAQAERALKAGVDQVAFDRGRFSYHGRVQALAEGARAGGLKF